MSKFKLYNKKGNKRKTKYFVCVLFRFTFETTKWITRYMKGGTYNLTLASNDIFLWYFSWQFYCTHGDLLRLNRRKNIFLDISRWCLIWDKNPDFTSKKSTTCDSLAVITYSYSILLHVSRVNRESSKLIRFEAMIHPDKTTEIKKFVIWSRV